MPRTRSNPKRRQQCQDVGGPIIEDLPAGNGSRHLRSRGTLKDSTENFTSSSNNSNGLEYVKASLMQNGKRTKTRSLRSADKQPLHEIIPQPMEEFSDQGPRRSVRSLTAAASLRKSYAASDVEEPKTSIDRLFAKHVLKTSVKTHDSSPSSRSSRSFAKPIPRVQVARQESSTEQSSMPGSPKSGKRRRKTPAGSTSGTKPAIFLKTNPYDFSDTDGESGHISQRIPSPMDIYNFEDVPIFHDKTPSPSLKMRRPKSQIRVGPDSLRKATLKAVGKRRSSGKRVSFDASASPIAKMDGLSQSLSPRVRQSTPDPKAPAGVAIALNDLNISSVSMMSSETDPYSFDPIEESDSHFTNTSSIKDFQPDLSFRSQSSSKAPSKGRSKRNKKSKDWESKMEEELARQAALFEELDEFELEED